MKKRFFITLAAVLILTAVFQITASAGQLDNTSHGYGQGNERDELNRPVGALDFNEAYREFNSFALLEDNDGIVLTFDQGYENGYTEKILDTLKDKNVRAVFFLTGDYAERNEQLVKRMINEGHIIGNHGMKHASLPSLDDGQIKDEIMSLHDFVREKYGYEMKWFRPPCGEYSQRALSACSQLGYKTLLWSFAYCDWNVDDQPDPSFALEKITGAGHNGAVYLLHSVSSTNAAVLSQAIDELRKQGFEFVLPSV